MPASGGRTLGTNDRCGRTKKRRTRRPWPPRRPRSEGAGPRRMRAGKTQSGRRAGKLCHEGRPAGSRRGHRTTAPHLRCSRRQRERLVVRVSRRAVGAALQFLAQFSGIFVGTIISVFYAQPLAAGADQDSAVLATVRHFPATLRRIKTFGSNFSPLLDAPASFRPVPDRRRSGHLRHGQGGDHSMIHSARN
jgi:hypothetical protein